MPPVPSQGVEVDASPARYLLKFESFSVLSANSITKYESSVFQSCGYKWKMIIYPDGDVSGDGKGHISVYLTIAETSSLPAAWEVNATFSFLVFDQIRDMFIVMKGMVRRFHNIKTEWGYSKCVSHATFKEPSNGYLLNDKCVFGVDVSVIKKQGLGECLSMLNGNTSYKYEWKICEFSKLKKHLYSEEFYVGDYKWKLLLYPAGYGDHKDRSISIFLVSFSAGSFDCQKKVKAKFSISIKDQISGSYRNKFEDQHWFSAAEGDWGWMGFMALHEFKNPKNGYLAEDCCIVGTDVSLIGVVNGFT